MFFQFNQTIKAILKNIIKQNQYIFYILHSKEQIIKQLIQNLQEILMQIDCGIDTGSICKILNISNYQQNIQKQEILETIKYLKFINLSNYSKIDNQKFIEKILKINKQDEITI